MSGGEDLPVGATPLDPDEAEGLRIKSIETRAELDPYEQANITDGIRWLEKQRAPEVLSEQFVRQFHGKLFGAVWKWAGTFRVTERNIGVAPHQIAPQLRELLDNTRVWFDQGVYPPRELALRFHHRLVQIHCFPNGNGRHARLTTDALCRHVLKVPPIDWSGGLQDLQVEGEHRRQYIAALQAADGRTFEPLLSLFPESPKEG